MPLRNERREERRWGDGWISLKEVFNLKQGSKVVIFNAINPSYIDTRYGHAGTNME